jgi:hypothetical protein
MRGYTLLLVDYREGSCGQTLNDLASTGIAEDSRGNASRERERNQSSEQVRFQLKVSVISYERNIALGCFQLRYRGG